MNKPSNLVEALTINTDIILTTYSLFSISLMKLDPNCDVLLPCKQDQESLLPFAIDYRPLTTVCRASLACLLAC